MTQNGRLSTGVAGLDEILDGGLIPGRFYLVRGGPGQGKTTLGLHFVTAPVAGENDNAGALFVTFQESVDQIRANAASQGIDCADVNFLNLGPDESFFAEGGDYDVFSAADVERDPLTSKIVEAVEQQQPARVFVDSMTQLRFISADAFQYRKQVLSFLRFLGERGSTVMFSSEHTSEAPDDDLQFLGDGVINLETNGEHSVVRVTKFRGSGFLRGPHDIRIDASGLKVFPRIRPAMQRTRPSDGRLPSGVPEVDQMLHGGIEAGTVTMISGPSGIGKSTFTSLFAKEAGALGWKTAAFLFEEDRESFLRRTAAVNIPIGGLADKGDVLVEQVEPMRYLADEFAVRVQTLVEDQDVRVVVLDSLSGYELALAGTGIRERMHALAKNLARRGVTVLIINEVEAMTGEFRVTEKNISYLADNIVFLRYVEFDGHLRKAIGVLKKRLSDFDRSLRQFDITPYGIRVSEPFAGMQGVLHGTPVQTPGGA